LAVVIWLFAGGGEAELGNREANIRGIDGFLAKHFPHYSFERKTPIRQKRLPAKVNALGKTGYSLAEQIKIKLNDAIKYNNPLCDAILILDDLDCSCANKRSELFTATINSVTQFQNIKTIIAFAAPELESWIIADWQHTIAKHHDFAENQQAMSVWLSQQGVMFNAPESFSYYNASKKSCHEKLSELLIESSIEKNTNKAIYSKSKHTPVLLYDTLKADIVAQKCPLFNSFFSQLQSLTV
jgi:hypothetical protein